MATATAEKGPRTSAIPVQRFLFDSNRTVDERVDKMVEHGVQRAVEVHALMGAANKCEHHHDKQRLMERAGELAAELGEYLAAAVADLNNG